MSRFDRSGWRRLLAGFALFWAVGGLGLRAAEPVAEAGTPTAVVAEDGTSSDSVTLDEPCVNPFPGDADLLEDLLELIGQPVFELPLPPMMLFAATQSCVCDHLKVTSRPGGKVEVRIYTRHGIEPLSDRIAVARGSTVEFRAEADGAGGDDFSFNTDVVSNIRMRLVRTDRESEEYFQWSNQGSRSPYTAYKAETQSQKLTARYTKTAGSHTYEITYDCAKCKSEQTKEKQLSTSAREGSKDIVIIAPEIEIEARSQYLGGAWQTGSVTIAAGGIDTPAHRADIKLQAKGLEGIEDLEDGLPVEIQVKSGKTGETVRIFSIPVYPDKESVFPVSSTADIASLTVQTGNRSVSLRCAGAFVVTDIVRTADMPPRYYGLKVKAKLRAGDAAIPLDSHALTLVVDQITVKQYLWSPGWDEYLTFKKTITDDLPRCEAVTDENGSAVFSLAPLVEGEDELLDVKFTIYDNNALK